MKPCFGKRKRIALLVLGGLDAGQANALRAHMNDCRGCHDYRNELAALCRAHRSAAENAPEVEPSPLFHQRLANRIRNEASPRFRCRPSLNLWGWLARRPVAVPVLVLVIGLGVTFGAWLQYGKRSIVDPVASLPDVKVEAETNFPPTFSFYRAAANTSLDTLEDLLGEQAQLKPASDRLLTVAASRIEMDE